MTEPISSLETYLARAVTLARRVPRWALLPLAVALFLIVTISGFYVADRQNEAWRLAIESEGANLLGVPVKVGAVAAHPRAHFIVISNIEIGNPDGYGGGDALYIGTLRLEGDFSSEPPLLAALSAQDVQVNLVMTPNGAVNWLNILAKGMTADKQGVAGQNVLLGSVELLGNVASIVGPTMRLHSLVMPGLHGAQTGVQQLTAAQAVVQLLQQPVAEAVIITARRRAFDDVPPQTVAALKALTNIDVTQISAPLPPPKNMRKKSLLPAKDGEGAP